MIAASPKKTISQVFEEFLADQQARLSLWLEPLTMHDGVIGPVPVPKQVTQICHEMWDIGGVVVKTRRGWRFLEIWKVSP